MVRMFGDVKGLMSGISFGNYTPNYTSAGGGYSAAPFIVHRIPLLVVGRHLQERLVWLLQRSTDRFWRRFSRSAEWFSGLYHGASWLHDFSQLIVLFLRFSHGVCRSAKREPGYRYAIQEHGKLAVIALLDSILSPVGRGAKCRAVGPRLNRFPCFRSSLLPFHRSRSFGQN